LQATSGRVTSGKLTSDLDALSEQRQLPEQLGKSEQELRLRLLISSLLLERRLPENQQKLSLNFSLQRAYALFLAHQPYDQILL
jgi:hypothetical protein